jgi:hypothetical protein
MATAATAGRRRAWLRPRVVVALACSSCALASGYVGVATADGGPGGGSGNGQGGGHGQGGGQGHGSGDNQGSGGGQGQGGPPQSNGNGQGHGQGQGGGQPPGQAPGNSGGQSPAQAPGNSGGGQGDGQGHGQGGGGQGQGHGNDGSPGNSGRSPGAGNSGGPTPQTRKSGNGGTTNATPAPSPTLDARIQQPAPTPVNAPSTTVAAVAPVVLHATRPIARPPKPQAARREPRRGSVLSANRRRVSASRPQSRLAADHNPLLSRVSLQTAFPPQSSLVSATRQPASTKPTPGSRQVVGANSQLPVIPTITKIINVVPLPARIVLLLMAFLALALAAHSRLAGVRARRLDRQRRQLLEDVGLLQGALVPVAPERLGGVGTSVAYRPSDGLAAGGDFYDLFALANGQVAVILGDLSGHGRRALPHTALVRYTLRAYLEAGMSPRDALQCVAPVLERQLGESLATVVAATYDPGDRTLVYACAGHPPPVVLGSRPIVPVTASSSPPIGAGLPTGMRQTTLSLPGRTVVCFYTDGVVEARAGTNLLGVAQVERTLGELGPAATASALLDRIADVSDERPDDMAACLLQVEGEPADPTVRMEELELDGLEAVDERSERFLAACGVSPGEIPELMRSARAGIARDGSVVLEVRFDNGAPDVALRQHEFAALPGSALQTA